MLVTTSIGMRTGAVQVVPLLDVLITMSFVVQPARKLQSYHTSYTLPAASTSAPSTSSERMPPAGVCFAIVATLNGPVKLAPPLVDLNAWMELVNPSSVAMMTFPFRCGSALAPITMVLEGIVPSAQVSPPSVEWETCRMLRLPTSRSNSRRSGSSACCRN